MHSQHILPILAFALPALADFTSTLGCYSKVPSLTAQKEFKFMSLGWCSNQCSEGGYRIAALSDGTQCSCGNEMPSDSAKVDDDKCDKRCTGFPEDYCGGNQLLTVLSTGEYSSADSSSSDSDSNSSMTDTIIMATATPSTAGGGIVVAPTNIDESNMPTGILTAPASMVSKASSSGIATAKVTSAPGITAASSSSTPSSTPNAADSVRPGPIAGALVAGLGLLL